MNQHYFDVPFAFSGDVTAIPDPLQTGGTVSFTEGWNYNYQRDLATDPAALPIDRSTMNWLLLQITTAIQALQQNGVPEFILASQNGGTAYSYAKGAVVNWSASGLAPFTKFVCIATGGNTNTPSLSDPTGATTGWQLVIDPIATSAQAAAGTDNASIMTPLLVAQQTALRALLAGSSAQVFNVGPATSATHAPEASQVQQNAFNYAGLAGGTANALTATLTIAPGGYSDYLTVVVRVAANNTGSTSINVNGLGVKPVIGAGHQLLQGGELIAGGFACFAYSTNYSEAILLWATGGGVPVGPATQSDHAMQLGQATGRLLNVQHFVATGTTTYVPTTGTTRVRVCVIGGGGAGGSTNATGSGQVGVGGGGGAGGYAESFLTSGFSGVTITVGAGGTIGSPTGGTSSFGALLSATGGQQGASGATAVNAPPFVSIGGNGGIGSGGNTINQQGGQGTPGIAQGATSFVSGGGGASALGAGGVAYPTQTNTGSASASAGGGGGGALAGGSTAAQNGGAGSAGAVIIYEYA